MFAKVIVFFLSFFVIFAAAGGEGCPTTTITATATPTATTVSQCNSHDQAYCCNNVGAANSSPATLPGIDVITGLLNLVIDPVTAIVGLGCTHITVLSELLSPCSHTKVCCTNNTFTGLINIGCVVL